jgi:phage terminase large subunit
LPNAIVDGYNGQQEGTTFIHTDYRDNKDNLSASFIKQVEGMKRERPDKYEHIILGGWLSKAEGAIIRNWRVGDYLQLEKTVYCQDFGFSKDLTTLVKLSVDKDNRRLYVREIFGKAGLSTSEIARLNKAECGLDLIIGDSSEPRLISELKALDINIKPTIKKKGSILSGIALMQDYEIIVDRSSKGVMKEFNNYVWQDKNEKPIDSYNHFCDAIRYGLQYLIQGSNSGTYVIR